MSKNRFQGKLPAVLLIIFMGCTLPSKEELLENPDLSPPRLVEIQSGEGPEVSLLFDEAVQPAEDRIKLDSEDTVILEVKDENCIVLTPETDLTPGTLYKAAIDGGG